MDHKLYYLASPFSHKEHRVMMYRAEQSSKACCDLLKLGIHVFGAICYNANWSAYNVPGDWAFWEAFDKNFLRRMDGLIVLMLDGWQQSVGVTAEIEYAKELGLPIHYINLEQIANNQLDNLR